MNKNSPWHILTIIAVCLALLLPACASGRQPETGRVPTRDQIDAKYKWQLEDIYATDALWEEDYSRMEQLISRIGQFQERLGESAADLLEALRLQDELFVTAGKLNAYANMRRDEDTRNTIYQALADRAGSLLARAGSAAAFVSPEILSISDDRLKGFLRDDPGLAVYRHYLDDITRVKPHILSKAEEAMLSSASELVNAPETVFTLLTEGDFTWPSIRDQRGKEVEVSVDRLSQFLDSTDRRVRRDAYRAAYAPYMAYRNTLAGLFAANKKAHAFIARSRDYNSSLEAALDGPKVPVEVYNNLISTVNQNLEPLHRWAELRKMVMQLDELHPYDAFAPIVARPARTYSFEEAKQIVLEALKPLGADYLKVAEDGFNNGWIDVFENVGKRSGGYSWGAYGTHPFILLNWNGTLNDVFTLAHEMGHAVHSYYTYLNQPFVYSSYATFNAEVASMTNEALLLDYLLNQAKDRDERLVLLQMGITNVAGGFYRQALFAEYEQWAHAEVEAGRALTADVLGQKFEELDSKYWGPEMVIDPEGKFVWARVPHFYFNFYVFNYSTSFAAAQAISQKILTEGQPAVKDYVQFLSMGSSDYPVELLKIAGVDMSTPQPIEAVAQWMDRLIDQVESILGDGA